MREVVWCQTQNPMQEIGTNPNTSTTTGAEGSPSGSRGSKVGPEYRMRSRLSDLISGSHLQSDFRGDPNH